MSASPSVVRAARAPAGSPVTIAGPPGRLAVAPAAAVATRADPWPWWTPEALKGWAGSVTLHAIRLVILGGWYFAPPNTGPIAFHSRLAGPPRADPERATWTAGR